MLAFKNDPAVKAKFLNRIKMHREADELVQDYGYWKDGKGCAIGCLAHRSTGAHAYLAKTWNVDERLLHLADAIFEGLPAELARKWPERFTSAIAEGADTSLVWHKFAVWLLRASQLLTITDSNREAIAAVIKLHVRGAKGDAPSHDEWIAARNAASAADAVWSAADAARNAASAADAVWSAAWSAASAARSAAYEKMAEKLIKLLKAAK
jgi:hypothetical protein